MKLYFNKTQSGLSPADQEAHDWLNKVKAGQAVSVDVKQVRNYRFLRKYFALLKVAFDNWEPPRLSVKVGGEMIVPEKNFDRFRKDLTILTGNYETVFRLDGSYRIEPRSISFGKMTAEEFDKLYQATITVLIEQMWQKLDYADVDKMVNIYLGFA